MFNTPLDFAVWYGLLGMCLFAAASKMFALCRAKPQPVGVFWVRNMSRLNREVCERHDELAKEFRKLASENYHLRDQDHRCYCGKTEIGLEDSVSSWIHPRSVGRVAFYLCCQPFIPYITFRFLSQR